MPFVTISKSARADSGTSDEAEESEVLCTRFQYADSRPRARSARLPEAMQYNGTHLDDCDEHHDSGDGQGDAKNRLLRVTALELTLADSFKEAP